MQLLMLLLLLLFSVNIKSEYPPRHVEIAKRYNGWKELSNNRGWVADSSNKYVGNAYGSPYCQAFVSWILSQSGTKDTIRTGLAQKFYIKGQSFKIASILTGVVEVENGDIITWQKGNTINGHAGIAIENWRGSLSGYTIQANTYKSTNSREGDGIYIKKAFIDPLNYKFKIIRITKIRY